jgi:hypothetical protein
VEELRTKFALDSDAASKTIPNSTCTTLSTKRKRIKNSISGITFWTGGTLSGNDYIVNTVERMRVTNTGNVGIGTDNPAQKLDVNGRADTRQLHLPCWRH